MARRTFTSRLYRAARVSNNLSLIASGKPRMTHPARDVAVGRTLRRAGVWRWLWR